MKDKRKLFEINTTSYYIRDLRRGEEIHPVVKWAFWLFLLILLFIGVGGYSGVIPLYMQPVLLKILVPLLVILSAFIIIGWFKSFDRSGWLVFIAVVVFILLIGILSILFF